MAEFNLADVLAQSVSKLDTGRENIEYIPREKIHADPGNFYSMDGIDQLAANIELCGLMDPIRIRADGNGYKIVSGHRRFAAMTILADAGNETYQQIPCIIDTSQVSEAMQELRLIYANSDTRKLSSADLNKQVERVTELLYKLKEEGVEFPGRMRDHVAEACKLSKSKIARLNAINKGLGSTARELYEGNKISESVAYALSSLSRSYQNIILMAMSLQGLCVTECRVSRYAQRLKNICDMPCSHGDACEHIQEKMNQIAYDEKHYNWIRCDSTCCLKCDRLALCKTVCIHATAAQAEAKEAKKASAKAARDEKKAEAERQRKIAQSDMERKQAMYQLVSQQIQAQGLAVEPLLDTVKLYHYRSDLKSFLSGDYEFMTGNSTVLSTGVSLNELDCLCAMADYLHMTLDDLVMHTPVKETPVEPHVQAALVWQTDALYEHGAYAVEVEIGEGLTKFLLAYKQPYHEKLSMSRTTYRPIELPILRWFKLPDMEE